MRSVVAVNFLVTFLLMANVDPASVSLSSNELTLNGDAHIRFFGPREEIWNGLSNGKNFMIFVSFLDLLFIQRVVRKKKRCNTSFTKAFFFLLSLSYWPNESRAPSSTNQFAKGSCDTDQLK